MTEEIKQEFNTTFIDNKENRWSFKLTVGDVMRLGEFYSCNANEVLHTKVAEVLLGGTPLDLCVLFWGILQKQAEEKGIDQETFQDCFTAEDWETMVDRMKNGILAFTRPAKRAVVQAALSQMDLMQEMVTQESMEALVSPELKEQTMKTVRRQIQKVISQTGS